MAKKIVIKCDCCGNDIIIDENSEFGKCKSCGYRVNLSDFEEKNKANDLISKAVALRNKCDFQEAEAILKDFLSEEPNNYRIFFQLLLCEYGVSYVDENDKVKNVPIINYAKKEQPSNSIYYKKAVENCHKNYELERLKRDVKQLDELNNDVYSIFSQGTKKYQIFISYKKTWNNLYTEDSHIARRIYDKLTQWGIENVFFADESLNKDAVGFKYEPYIYQALFSAKIFILVAGSPSYPEMLQAPWVKSEWSRFSKRLEDEKDSNLRFVTVLANGFKESLLPSSLQKYQALKLDDTFDSSIKSLIYQMNLNEDHAGFENKEIESKMNKIQIQTEKIEFKGFSGHKNVELDLLETEYEVALMKLNAGNFENAYERLEKIQKENPFNFDLNKTKLKCDFRLHDQEPFPVDGLLRLSIADYPRVISDFKHCVSVADKEQREEIVETFKEMVCDLFITSPLQFTMMLQAQGSDFFYAIVETYPSLSDKGLLEYLNTYKDVFLSDRNKICEHLAKDSPNVLDYLIHDFFKKYYSQFGNEGAKIYLGLVKQTYSILLNDNSQLDVCKKYVDEYISINDLDYEILWDYFIFNLFNFKEKQTKSTSIVEKLAKVLTEDNFIEISLDKDTKLSDNATNLYYYIISFVKGGLQVNVNNIVNPFYFIFNACMIMINNPKKVDLAKNILYLMATLLDSSKTGSQDSKHFLVRCGERLLIENKFNDATQYFEEALKRDEKCLAAYWGLAKCQACCPTNYSVLLYRGSTEFIDLPNFRKLIHAVKNSDIKHDYFTDFVMLLEDESLMNDPKIERALRLFEKELLDADDPREPQLKDIILRVRSREIISLSRAIDPEVKAEEERRRELERKNLMELEIKKKKEKEHEHKISNAANIVYGLFALISILGVAFLHPLFSFGILLVLSLTSVILSSLGFKGKCNVGVIGLFSFAFYAAFLVGLWILPVITRTTLESKQQMFMFINYKNLEGRKLANPLISTYIYFVPLLVCIMTYIVREPEEWTFKGFLLFMMFCMAPMAVTFTFAPLWFINNVVGYDFIGFLVWILIRNRVLLPIGAALPILILNARKIPPSTSYPNKKGKYEKK